MDRTLLLLVEDDEKLCRLLRDYLTPLGYVVEAVHDGREGLARAASGEHAAVILDVMLPGLSGLDVLRDLRRTSQVPVLMLTALGDEVDRISGLEIGADDYCPRRSPHASCSPGCAPCCGGPSSRPPPIARPARRRGRWARSGWTLGRDWPRSTRCP